MQITNVKCPESKYAIKCPDVTEKIGICVHNTANDATAMAEVSYMIGNDRKCSFHVAVDDERVVTALPFERSCFAAGDGRRGKGNANYINIEICYSKSGGERFEQAEENACSYIAMLLKERGWGIDRVKKHQDFSGKYCPHRTLDLGWDRFLNKIRKHLEIQVEEVKPQNIEQGSDVEVRKYINGSTPEITYMDSNCTKAIGKLSPREQCDCFGIFNNRAMVRYQVGNTGNYKIAFCKWLGGVK